MANNIYVCSGEAAGVYDAVLSHSCSPFPAYDTEEFWHVVESTDTSAEALVHCLRISVFYRDLVGRNVIFSTLVRRIQRSNEYWASRVLRWVTALPDEQRALRYDLCADLYESLFRALVDTHRSFWEENFQHALQFERRHVYRAFMMREGRWHDRQVKQSTRIPRMLITRLDQPLPQERGDTYPLEIEDERAYKMLLAIETSDLFRQVLLHLPAQLKAVILLLFWEGRSEKDTAHILGITDRTVRNRRRNALNVLRKTLNVEEW